MFSRAEAIHFFNLPPDADDDELGDALQEALFEHKKFILTQNPVPVVLEKRLEKIAFLIPVERLINQDKITFEKTEIRFPDNSIYAIYSLYQKHLSEFKTALNRAERASRIHATVEGIIDLKKTYYGVFDSFFKKRGIFPESPKPPQASLGKEPDEMELLEAIKEFEKNGLVNVNLQKEIRRIHLILERYSTKNG